MLWIGEIEAPQVFPSASYSTNITRVKTEASVVGADSEWRIARRRGNGMSTRHVTVSVLTVAFAAIVAFCALILMPQGARAAPVSVKTCDGGTITLNPDEKRVLELHNRARTRRGLKALCVHPALTEAARAHSKEMIEKDYTSHDPFNGETVMERLERYGYTFAGYSYYLCGENIAWGCGSAGDPESIFKSWMHSPDHKATILNKRFREVGIGVLTGTYKGCTRAAMYTVDFGVRRP
jgi:uncharacterized protein YkwD